jgi:hypothetical protein
MSGPQLLAESCVGGDCPQIHRDGDDWLIHGYDTRTGQERTVRIPAALAHSAADNDA